MQVNLKSILRDDISRLNVPISQDEWDRLQGIIEDRHYPKKSVIFSQVSVCNEVLFITDGITASEFVTEGGKPIITRFFLKNNLCSNVVSAVSGIEASDNVYAVTATSAISIPYDLFYKCYLRSGKFGEYLRIKMLLNLVEVKNFLSIKTISSTKSRYQFLENNYPEILRLVPQKDIANFLGLTPEGFSRFLRNYLSKS